MFACQQKAFNEIKHYSVFISDFALIHEWTFYEVTHLLSQTSDALFSFCPWHIFTRPASQPPLPKPGSSSAGIPCKGLAGTPVPTVVNTDPALNLSSSCLSSPGWHFLTMFLCCCLFSRDCGGSGKRKSGKAGFTWNIFIQLLIDIKSSEVPFIKAFNILTQRNENREPGTRDTNAGGCGVKRSSEQLCMCCAQSEDTRMRR